LSSTRQMVRHSPLGIYLFLFHGFATFSISFQIQPLSPPNSTPPLPGFCFFFLTIVLIYNYIYIFNFIIHMGIQGFFGLFLLWLGNCCIIPASLTIHIRQYCPHFLKRHIFICCWHLNQPLPPPPPHTHTHTETWWKRVSTGLESRCSSAT
jgi:hypothetical protein